MKRILLLLLWVGLGTGLGSAQSLSLIHAELDVSNDTLYLVGTTQDALLESHVEVKNLTDKELEVKARKAEIQIVENSENTFCWGACFPPFIFEATQAILIPANGSDKSSFVGDYTPDGNAGTSIIRYTFFVAANPADSVSLIVHYQVGAAGIRDWTKDPSLFKVYPNPSSSWINLEFPGSGSQLVHLRLFSITGQVLEDRQLNNGQNSLKMDLRRYPDGVLFVEITDSTGTKAIRKIHKAG